MSQTLNAFHWRENMAPIGDRIGTYRSEEQREVMKKRIKQLRRAGWSDKQIAEHLQISRSYVGDLAGRRRVQMREDEQ